MSFYGFEAPIEDQTFSDKETNSIMSSFQEIEIPLHLLFRSQVRWNAKLIANSAVALSPHFVNLYQQKKKGDAFKLYCSVFIGDITLIGYTDEQYVLVQSNDHNIILYATQGLKFAQLLYRNYQLSFSAMMDKNVLTLKCRDTSLFPRLELPLSPTQQFQLTYLAACVKMGVPYNHQVVRYVHTMLLSQNTIIDISQLPIDYSNPREQSSIIKPMFTTLGEMNFLSGICCSDIKKPNLIDLMTEFIKLGTNFRIVHFNNCGITGGFSNLSKNARSNSEFNVNYWDLSGNPNITDLQSFAEVLSYNQNPVYLLNLSKMNIQPKIAAKIWDVISRNQNFYGIRHLFLHGFPFQDANVQKHITEFLENANKDSRFELQTLDLSHSGQGLDQVLRSFCSYKMPLKTLLLNDNQISASAFEVICFVLRTSSTIEKLDISGTNLTKANISTIISTISDNVNIKSFRIILDRLTITNNDLLPILRAFLSSHREKWVEISLNGNNLTIEDVETLLALVKKMHNLEVISLSGNFTEKMKGIGELLGRFFLNSHIKKVVVQGSQDKKLGRELITFLQVAAQCTQLESLDVSNNLGKNEIIPLLSAIISQCRNLKSLKIDGNGITEFEKIEDLIPVIDQNESLITFSYPVVDGKNFVDSKKQKDQAHLISMISNQQVNIATKVSNHRVAQNMPSDLPFDASEDVIALVEEITKAETRKVRGRKLVVHSMACEEFHVPLPFQGDKFEEPEGVKLIDDPEKVKIYETPSLERFIEEDTETYKGVPFTTMNPDFNTLFEKQEKVEEKKPVERAVFLFEDEKQVEKVEKEEEEVKPKKKAPPLKKRQINDNDNDDDYRKIKKADDSDDDFEIRTRRISKKELARVLPMDFSDSSDDSSEYDESVDPSERAPKFVRKQINDDDEEPPQKPSKRSKPKSSYSESEKPKKKLSMSSASPEPEKPRKKLSITGAGPEIDRIKVEEEEEEEEEHFSPPPMPMKIKHSPPIEAPPPNLLPKKVIQKPPQQQKTPEKVPKKKYEFSDSEDYNDSSPSPPPQVAPLIKKSPQKKPVGPPPLHDNPFKKPKQQPKKLVVDDDSDDDIDVPPPPHVRDIVKKDSGAKSPAPSKIPIYNRNKFEFTDSD